MLQVTNQWLHLSEEGSSTHSWTETAILTFTGPRWCSKRGGQKQDISLDGPEMDPAQQI